MLHIAALFVAGTAKLDDDGAIQATRIPTTAFQVDKFPVIAEIPLVLMLHARAGGDYDPELHLVCKGPGGATLGSGVVRWHWPDDGDRASKWRCFAPDITFPVEAEGEYTIGAYYDAAGNIEMATPVPISITSDAPTQVADTGDTDEGDNETASTPTFI